MKRRAYDDALDSLVTVLDFIRWGATEFEAEQLHFGHGYDNAWDEAIALVADVLHFPIERMHTIAQTRLTREEAKEILKRYELRIEKRLPVSYITHTSIFAGMSFYVDERTIIPRSPIAELIEQQFTPWVEPEKVERILDLCTGSGCIAIAASHYLPDAIVDAVDISPDALAVTEKNIQAHGLEERVRPIESDLFSALTGEKYDIIVSNPPYVPGADVLALPKEYTHEPDMALEGGRTGLNLVLKILQHAHEFIHPHGILVMEVGLAQDALVEQLPNVPFLWLEFARGGEGVFILTADQILHHQSDFEHVYNQTVLL